MSRLHVGIPELYEIEKVLSSLCCVETATQIEIAWEANDKLVRGKTFDNVTSLLHIHLLPQTYTLLH